MEHKYGAQLNNLKLRPLIMDDLELLRQWRNDKTISKYLRKIDYITSQQQLLWYNESLIQPNSYYWTIAEKDKAIGALAIYNIEEKKAEIGRIMIGDVLSQGKGYGYQALIMAIKIGFQLLKLTSYRLTVHKRNLIALHIYKKIGFTVNNNDYFCNTDDVEIEMMINKQTYEEKNQMSNNIIVFSDISIITPPRLSENSSDLLKSEVKTQGDSLENSFGGILVGLNFLNDFLRGSFWTASPAIKHKFHNNNHTATFTVLYKFLKVA